MRNMKQFLIAFLFGLLLPSFSFAQTLSLKSLSFHKVDSLMMLKPKLRVIYFYTNWCKYCHLMKENSLSNSTIIAVLNRDFYYMAFNGESQESINFSGHSFDFIPTGNKSGVHELTLALGSIDGKINYPTLCVLNEKNEIIFQSSGFITTENLGKILNMLLNESQFE